MHLTVIAAQDLTLLKVVQTQARIQARTVRLVRQAALFELKRLAGLKKLMKSSSAYVVAEGFSL